MLLCVDPDRYIQQTAWIESFGRVRDRRREDWGKVQSLRVFYHDAVECEFGITGLDWAALPPDAGTAAVIRNGARILIDRDGLLSELIQAVGGID